MISLALAASLMFASAAESAAPAAHPTLTGAPTDDYQFVAWCYGALAGYLDLHDQVMPEVTRIESTWRRPGSKLADDLKVYADQQRQGQQDLKRFRAAMTAAEKASPQPLNASGAAALQRGRSVWSRPADISNATVAREWMSWSLPAKCEITAKTLEQRSKLLGASLKANVEPAEAAPADAAPAEASALSKPAPATN